jgi:geranylgeranyl pyrophosphate synthase
MPGNHHFNILLPNPILMSFYELAQPEIREVERYISSVLEAEPREVYGMLNPYIMRGGKRIRPTLAILCCKAVGGDPRKVVKPAGIIEMFHNFSLIHDDIADSSQFRRGEPTLHISHGIPIALNSGDALYTVLFKELFSLEIEPSKLITLEKEYVQTFKTVVEGQGKELEWERKKRFDITEDEYLSMIYGKTSALIGLSCGVGACIGGAEEKLCERFRAFGMKVGAAFQIQDDVLNVTGNFEKYQKEIGGDITEGKRTLMVIHCLGSCTRAERDKVTAILDSHSSKKEDIGYVIDCFKRHGSIDYARGKAAGIVKEAGAELSVLPASKEKKALAELCSYIISRET